MEGLILEGKEISGVIYNAACTGVGAGIFEFWIARIRGEKRGEATSGGCKS